MLQNSNQRLNIWITLQNRFDYQEMTNACIAHDVKLFTAFEFAQKAGLATCAKTMYPELSDGEAYLKFVSEYNSQIVQQTTAPVFEQQSNIPHTSGCAGCGGGTVK